MPKSSDTCDAKAVPCPTTALSGLTELTLGGKVSGLHKQPNCVSGVQDSSSAKLLQECGAPVQLPEPELAAAVVIGEFQLQPYSAPALHASASAYSEQDFGVPAQLAGCAPATPIPPSGGGISAESEQPRLSQTSDGSPEQG